MNIIALDLGSVMGLAHNVCGDVVITEHREFSGTRAHRNGAILNWLTLRFTEIAKTGKVDLVVYERPFARGFDATRSGWGIAGIVEGLATNVAKAAVTDCTPQDIKKFALGKAPARGRKRGDPKPTSREKKAAHDAEKLAMIDAAVSLGYVGDNEHEADAFLLLKRSEKHALVLPSKGK